MITLIEGLIRDRTLTNPSTNHCKPKNRPNNACKPKKKQENFQKKSEQLELIFLKKNVPWHYSRITGESFKKVTLVKYNFL